MSKTQADFERELAEMRAGKPAGQATGKTQADFERDLAEIRGEGMKSLMQEQGILPGGPAVDSGIHEEYRKGLLGRRLARQQKNDEERSALDAVGPLDATAKAIQATLLNVGQVIPGMKAVQAGIGAGLSHLPGMEPMTYSQALQASDEMTGKIPTGTRILGQGLAGVGLAPLLPANPAYAGALLGYADQALSPELDQSLVGRTGRGIVGAGAGYAAGHLLEKGGTMVKAGLTPKPQDNILARQAERARVASEMYGAAQSEGERNGANTAVRNFIAEPDIAERIAQLKTLEQYQNTAPDSPEMIAALARSMSDEAKALSKGMGQIDPSKPNTLMEKAKSLGIQKRRLLRTVSEPSTTTKPPITLDVAPELVETQPVYSRGTPYAQGHAMEGTAGRAMGDQAQVALDPSGAVARVSPGQVQGPAGPAFQLREDPSRMIRPGVEIQTPAMRIQTAPAETVTEPAMMESFRPASEDFARRTREIEAIGKGMNAVQGASKDATPTFNQIQSKNTKTPETFAAWYKTASDAERKAAIEGILGDVRNSASLPGKTFGPLRRRAGEASDILRDVDPTSTQDILRLLGLTQAVQPYK